MNSDGTTYGAALLARWTAANRRARGSASLTLPLYIDLDANAAECCERLERDGVALSLARFAAA